MHHLLHRYTTTGWMLHTQCEQAPGADPDSAGFTQFASNLSNFDSQTIPCELWCPSPPDRSNYTMNQVSLEAAGLLVNAVQDQENYCFTGPQLSPPICWRDTPMSWGEHGYTSAYLATSYLPYTYSTPLPRECVSTGAVYRSLSDAMSSNWSASSSNTLGWDGAPDSNAAIHSERQRRSKLLSQEVHKDTRIASSACGEDTSPTHSCSPCKRFKCQFKAHGSREGEVCGGSFVRIEHLRRHIKTVHGDSRTQCKVPQCKKSFSRSDNLYDHYWTHLDLKKPGRNLKLSLEKLEEILGSWDSRISNSLRRRMSQPRRPRRWDRRRSRLVTGSESCSLGEKALLSGTG
jgi:hypothetical protein